MITVPNLPELSLEKQWPILNELIPKFREYMPDSWYANPYKRVDRKFMWAVASYLDKHYVMMVIEEVRSLRSARKAQRIVIAADIAVADEWVQKMMQGTFQPRK